jgi:hypothetical protein
MQRTSPWEAAASPKYISYVSLSLKQKKETTAREVKRPTGKSTKYKITTKRKRRKSMSQLVNGE